MCTLRVIAGQILPKVGDIVTFNGRELRIAYVDSHSVLAMFI